ncbi:MAG: VOC family protein [Actinomycetota bacterium]|nr:VOC family protein [Actinomycetota bacterium]
MTSISPCLWFDDNLEEALELYTSIFPRSSVGNVSRYGEVGPGTPGTVMAADFELDGLGFRAINGGPQYHFTEAVSFSVSCKDQAEVDHYWGALCEGGQEGQCGWLKDRFGLSWQIIPVQLFELMSDPDPARAQRVTKAMLGMKKIVVPELQAAADAG